MSCHVDKLNIICVHDYSIMKQLVLEAVIVGVVLMAVLGVLHWAAPVLFKSPWTAALTGFVLGVVVHLGFEITGLNRTYCSVGHACKNKVVRP